MTRCACGHSSIAHKKRYYVRDNNDGTEYVVYKCSYCNCRTNGFGL